jgi:tetratricopeptide (TPR) repeat protein
MSMGISFACIFNRANTCSDSLRLASLRVLVTGFIFTFAAQQSFAAETAWQKSLAIGDTKLASQYISQAEEHYKRAIKELHMVKHTSGDEVKCLTSFANALTLENKTDEALLVYKNTLAILEKADGNSSVKILPTLFALGSIYESVGDHDLAMQYYKRAIAINESHYDSFCPAFVNQFPHDQIVAASNNNFVNDKYNQTTTLTLIKQPGLRSSKILEDMLPNYKEDMVKNEYNSDQELTSVFDNEIAKGVDKDNDIASGSIAPSSVKQFETAK